MLGARSRSLRGLGARKPVGFPRLLTGSPAVGGIRAGWLLNEGGGSSVFELSGRFDSGVINGNPIWGAGQFSSPCLVFDGSDYISLGSTAGIVSTDACSVLVWVKTTTTNRSMVISNATSGINFNGTLILDVLTTGNIRWLLATDASNSSGMDSTSAVNDGRWHQVVGTRSGSTYALYIDGKPNGTPVTFGSPAAVVNVNSTQDLQLCGSNGVASNLVGSIDHAVLWRGVALTPGDVAFLYLNPFSFLINPTPDLGFGVGSSASQNAFNASWALNANKLLGGGIC